MPLKTNKKTTGKRRRTFRKPKPSYNRLVTRGTGNINQGMFSDQPFPPRKHCKIVYCGTHNMSSNAVQTFGSEQQYSLNGLYDPNITGVGHQPMGFDELMAIYTQYKVVSTKVELTWSNPDADGAFVGYKLAPLNDATVLTSMNFDKAQESRTVIMRPINNTGSQVVKQIFNVPPHIMLGITKSQYNAETSDYTGNATINPVYGYGFRFAMCNPTTASTVTCSAHVRIIFDVEFFARKSLPQS